MYQLRQEKDRPAWVPDSLEEKLLPHSNHRDFLALHCFPSAVYAARWHRRQPERIPACPDSDCGHEHSLYIHVSGLAKKGA